MFSETDGVSLTSLMLRPIEAQRALTFRTTPMYERVYMYVHLLRTSLDE